MMRKAITMVVWAALAVPPATAGAQAIGEPTPAPGTCDCPAGDKRGALRNLAAFAPLGLLGAVAAAGGLPALAVRGPVARPPGESGSMPKGSDVVTVEPARNIAIDSSAPRADRSRSSYDRPLALRRGVRPPPTGTPLPSVFLLGSGLIAIGCVAIIRSRG